MALVAREVPLTPVRVASVFADTKDFDLDANNRVGDISSDVLDKAREVSPKEKSLQLEAKCVKIIECYRD